MNNKFNYNQISSRLSPMIYIFQRNMSQLWSDIGYTSKEARTRLERVALCLEEAFEHCSDLEYEMFDIIGDHIRSREANCIELASRLNFDFSNRLVEVGFDKMPLIEQSQFYRSLAKELRDKLKAVRRDQLICQLNKRAELAYELGNEQDLPAYSLERVTDDDVQNLEKDIQILEELKHSRVDELIKFAQKLSLIVHLCDFKMPQESSMNELMSAIANTRDPTNLVNTKAMKRMRMSLAKWSEQAEQNVRQAGELRDQIDQFTRSHRVFDFKLAKLVKSTLCSSETICELKREWNELRYNPVYLKADIITCRKEIQKIWAECGLTSDSTPDFNAFIELNKTSDFTYELLKKHQSYLSVLEKNRDASGLIRNWLETSNQYEQFELKYSDSNKLKRQGIWKDYNFKIEDQLRKNFKDKLKKLEQEIHEKVTGDFMFRGVPFIEFVKQQSELLNPAQVKKSPSQKTIMMRTPVQMVSKLTLSNLPKASSSNCIVRPKNVYFERKGLFPPQVPKQEATPETPSQYNRVVRNLKIENVRQTPAIFVTDEKGSTANYNKLIKFRNQKK